MVEDILFQKKRDKRRRADNSGSPRCLPGMPSQVSRKARPTSLAGFQQARIRYRFLPFFFDFAFAAFSSITAWAAARRATGTRNGEALT
jgi:hypothetical protein